MKISDIIDINFAAEEVHAANKKWWYDVVTGGRLDRDKAEQLMLVVTELAEAMEGARKNLMDDHLPQYKMEHVEIIDAFIRILDYRYGHGFRGKFISHDYPGPMPSHQFLGREASYGEALGRLVGLIEKIRNTVVDGSSAMTPVGLDWFIDSCYWYACYRGFDHLFIEIYNAKMKYNATRIDHTIEHRLSEHGKKI